MKVILLLGVLLLVACSKQIDSQTDGVQQENQDIDVMNALDFVQQQKKLASTYSQTDPAVSLNMLNTVAVVRSLYSNFPAHFVEQDNMFQTTESIDEKVTPFNRFNDWKSIKVFNNKTDQNLNHTLVEVYDQRSYQQSKKETFDLCKNIWSNIDHRVPDVIDELELNLKKREQQNLSAVITQVKYGYRYHLDASHYLDGYPVVCSIAYDKRA